MTYDDLQKQFAVATKYNEDLLKKVKEDETPQHILFMKGYASTAFETEKCKCERINDIFYFNEAMVNKLMTYAYEKAIQQTLVDKSEIKKELIDALIYQLQDMK